MTFRPRTPVIALLGLAWAGVGCTGAMWRAANEDRAICRSLLGTTATPVGRAVAVRYAPLLTPDETDTLLIPLDSAGRPVAPFALPATVRDCENEEVASRQPAVYAAAQLDVGVVDPSAVVRIGGSARSDDAMPEAAHLFFSGEVGVYVVPYRVGAGGQLTVVPLDRVEINGAFQHFRVPDGAAALLIPATLPRPALARSGAQLRAACLTPVTAIADLAQATPGVIVTVALAPVAVPLMLLFAYGVSHQHPPTTQAAAVVPSDR